MKATRQDARALDPAMDPCVVSEIDAMLDRIEAGGVRILWAAESGSRAWGFPSPDSDYDARFIYVRPTREYLSLQRVRDVIEHPVDDTFDVNGWDVRKALLLLIGGNASPGEWLRSPITYRGDTDARTLLLDTAAAVIPFDGLLGHHYHVAQHALADVARTGKTKKFLYALREAITCRWMLGHGPGLVPPMDLPTLVAAADVPVDVRDAVQALIHAKRTLPETGTLPIDPALAAYINDQLSRTALYREAHTDTKDAVPPQSAWDRLDATFMTLLNERM